MSRMSFALYGILLGGLLCLTAQAQTVPKETAPLKGDTVRANLPQVVKITKTAAGTWSGTYLLADTVVVQAPDTLQIKAGTRLLMQRGAIFIVRGVLYVDGTNEAPVRFLPADTAGADSVWEGVFFLGENPCELHYCMIQGSRYGLWCRGASLSLQYCTLVNSRACAVQAENSFITGYQVNIAGKPPERVRKDETSVLEFEESNIFPADTTRRAAALAETVSPTVTTVLSAPPEKKVITPPKEKELAPALFSKLVFQNFSKSGDTRRSYGQASMPLTLFYPYRNNMQVVLQANAGYMTNHEQPGHLAGLTDIRLSTIGFALRHRLMLAGGINLPTGRSRLNNEEAGLQYAMADDDLAFAIKNFGEGFGMNMGAAYADKYGPDIQYGAGAGYYFKGAYRKYSTSDVAYDPGDIITFTGGLDYRRQEQLFRCDLSSSIFLAEREDGVAVFRQGAMLMVKTAWFLPLSGGQLQVRLFDVYRMKNRSTRNNRLEVEEYSSAGNRLGSMLYYTRPVRPKLSANGGLDMTVDQPNGYGQGSVFHSGRRLLFCLKAGGVYAWREDLQLESIVRLHRGNVGERYSLVGGEGIWGLELETGIRYGF